MEAKAVEGIQRQLGPPLGSIPMSKPLMPEKWPQICGNVLIDSLSGGLIFLSVAECAQFLCRVHAKLASRDPPILFSILKLLCPFCDVFLKITTDSGSGEDEGRQLFSHKV